MRRRLPHLLVALGLALLAGIALLLLLGRGQRPAATTTVAAGNPGWRIDRPAGAGAIEGYSSSASVAPGGVLELHVSTSPAARYRIEVYRLGWYGGAGGRLIACRPDGCGGDEQGAPQPVPAPDPVTGEVRAAWPVTDAIPVHTVWRSGEYVAKLILASGEQAAVPFVVRPSSGARPRILVVAPVNTWQAYNTWGGLSAYSSPRSAVEVSFDRPYADDAQYRNDRPLARFLDRYGFDAGFVTDTDVDADPALLRRAALIVIPGHSEYWTSAMRDGLERAVAEGVNVASTGGNAVYWHIRYTDAARRTLAEYRSASGDPAPASADKTVRWRDAPLNRPECRVLGVQWQGGDSSRGGPFDYVVAAADPWFRGTGLRPGDRVKGAVDYEWDALDPSCATPPLTVLFHHRGPATAYPPGVYRSSFHTSSADAVRFRAPSGATVFAAGSIDFALPADPLSSDAAHPYDPRLARFLRNVLHALEGR